MTDYNWQVYHGPNNLESFLINHGIYAPTDTAKLIIEDWLPLLPENDEIDTSSRTYNAGYNRGADDVDDRYLQGHDEGYDEGYDEGFKDGCHDGYEEAKKEFEK